jgi:hypothetical protein
LQGIRDRKKNGVRFNQFGMDGIQSPTEANSHHEEATMLKIRHPATLVWTLLALMVTAPACANVNKSITIGDNTETGSESTVNGSISVGSGAVVNGSLSTVNGTIRIDDDVSAGDVDTVNGSIRIGDGTAVEDVESVNGSIRMGERVTVDGEIDVVNGKITLGNGSTVADDVSNVNGEFQISGTEIGGNLSTINGDVWLMEGSVVSGDLIVEKPNGWGSESRKRKPKIVVGAGSRVVGTIYLEREVELYVSDTAEVGDVSGEMSIDDAVRFSGDKP